MIDLDGLYEWNFDMNTNQIQYVGDMGGAYMQYVNNYLFGTYYNTSVMNNDVFENIFGINLNSLIINDFKKNGGKIVDGENLKKYEKIAIYDWVSFGYDRNNYEEGFDYYDIGTIGFSYRPEIWGVSVGYKIAIDESDSVVGYGLSYLHNGEKGRLALTRYFNPSKNALDVSVNFSVVRIISTNSIPVNFSTLKKFGNEYNGGLGPITFGAGGASKFPGAKSPFLMKSIGYSIGFPISNGNYETYTGFLTK